MYKNNRNKLFNQIKDNSICIITSGQLQTRSNDTDYMPFRPNSNFLYLTGFNEPETIYVLIKKKNVSQSIIYLRPKDKTQEIWTGFRLGVEACPEALGIDLAKDILKFDQDLILLLEGIDHVYFDLTDFKLNKKITNKLQAMESRRSNILNTPSCLIHLPKTLNFLRLFKSSQEIEYISKACSISKIAHERAIAQSNSLQNERELLAIIEATFISNGATGSAYHSIVASGTNGLCLHYVENNKELKENDLILIDAGAEYNYYASDITRTFPKGKCFSSEQKLIYEIVLHAQVEAINFAKEGVTLSEVHQKATNLLVEGLFEFKILKGSKEQFLSNNKLNTSKHTNDKIIIKDFYPHGTSHFLGMDVHDPNPRYIEGAETKLQNGMIFTVEPGLYLYDYLDIPDQFKGIAIRIEDDILIKEDKSFNLSSAIPKTIEDIENIKK